MSLWQISIDTGGTFTDCIAVDPNGKRIRRKVLSNSTLRGELTGSRSSQMYSLRENWNVQQDLFRGYTFNLLNDRFSAIVVAYDPSGKNLTLSQPVPASVTFPIAFELKAFEETPVLATRLVTGTLLEEPFPKIIMRLGSTKGTNALLEGKGAKTAFFVTKGFKDLIEIGTQQRPELFAKQIIKRKQLYHTVIEIDERLDKNGKVLTPLVPENILPKLTLLKEQNVQSAAIAFLHSYKNPEHENTLKKVLLDFGVPFVSTSAELAPLIKLLPRAETAIVNAYLDPVLDAYLTNVSRKLAGGQLVIMTSSGGLVPAQNFKPKDSLLSGPAGGVVGAAYIARQVGISQVISFDMGGTSTDVARYDKGFDYRYEQQVGDAHLFSPSLHIETVAAGGGSICSFDGHQFKVGPESAGAFPGPACYGAGGPLTLTDIHLLLGRLDPSLFSIPVYPEQAAKRLNEVLAEVRENRSTEISEEALLHGFLQLANEIMAGAIRKISVSKGYDPRSYTMMAFGGAGGLQACSLAGLLGMNAVLIAADGGLLSAYGIGEAQIEKVEESHVLQELEEVFPTLETQFEKLASSALKALKEEHVVNQNYHIRSRLVFLRFKGQDGSLEVGFKSKIDDLINDFYQKYQQQYGHLPKARPIEVESLRVVASTTEQEFHVKDLPKKYYSPSPHHYIRSFFKEQWIQTPVFYLEKLKPGAKVIGPSILLDPYSTTVLEHGWELTMLNSGIARMNQKYPAGTLEKARSIADLELFSNRFMAIAEDMGAMLQRTALSVNVKERLDFSCAVIDPNGELIANAPHIPVHLGSLGVCVRLLTAHMAMGPGDVIVTNHPRYGGSHLPDITLVMPVFSDSQQLLGYVVNRAHHAEIGGTRPGSMPPDAKHLAEEGVVIEPFYLIKNGTDHWDEMEEMLSQNRFPSRSVIENLADLNAALAANVQGANALRTLAKQYGTNTVLSFMDAIKNNAGKKMRARLRTIPDGIYEAIEYLDDLTPLKVKITIKKDHCTIDFTGSGAVHPGNLNANQAIVNSVVIYVLRLLLEDDLPLNEGLLQPVRLILPKGILNPDFPDDHSLCPAVVGGNTETSQRLTGTLLKAFGILASSQGTMNNVLFGNEQFGYYETIGGGGGAGPGFHGASAVHHHMTNTRITDPEVMEHRYPVRLIEFSVREHSGGKGKWQGGDGITRKIQFLEKVKLSVLTQHRIKGPYGMKGGADGKAGRQFIIKVSGKTKKLSSIDQADIAAGDVLVIKTPGGGGYG